MHDYLTQHWKLKHWPAGDTVTTLTNEVVLGQVLDREVAAHIVKTHNESLIHPDKLIRSVTHLLSAMDCHLESIPPQVMQTMEDVRGKLEEG